MKWEERTRGVSQVIAALARLAAFDVRRHWMAALLSLLTALILWAIIEDIENPRVEGRAPAEGGIEVEALNIPDGYVVEALQTVLVRVEAREGDLESLRRSDFRAEVDLARVDPADGLVRVPVKVVSRRSDVVVLEVIPSSVDVSLTRSLKRDVEVKVRVVEVPPAGFRIKQVDGVDVPPLIDPPLVTVSGTADLVERVDRVELEVSLATAKTRSFVVSGDLVVRSADGNVLQVTLSDERATATFAIEEIFTPSAVGLQPRITGQPEKGYVVTNISVEPSAVEVTGPTAVIEGLQGPLALEPVDVTGARASLTRTITIQPPPNVSIERQTVVIRVDIAPIRCGTSTAAPCESASFWVGVNVTDIPTGFAVQPTRLQTQVRVSGPLATMATLTTADIKATVSLAGATTGAGTYTVAVTVPAGLTAESVDQVTITLVPAGTP
ncbi:MAG: YbbR-like domain-containing protein [Dehalococcoidia bacterium]